MSSAAKALALLSYFSTTRPEIGLSQLCRLAKRDKATTYRHLQALETAGFVEQNPATKQYRLGPAVMQLAQVREETVPRKDGAKPVLKTLADATGETAHASVLSGTTLYALCACESPHHGTRAVIDISTFPLHATASGLCALAFGPPNLMDVATGNLKEFTPKTPTSPTELSTLIGEISESGFSEANQIFETEIHSIAAPIFDPMGNFAGAVAVASVASRFTPQLEHSIKSELILAARQITRNWGGVIPAHVEAIWAKSVTQSTELETAS